MQSKAITFQVENFVGIFNKVHVGIRVHKSNSMRRFHYMLLHHTNAIHTISLSTIAISVMLFSGLIKCVLFGSKEFLFYLSKYSITFASEILIEMHIL